MLSNPHFSIQYWADSQPLREQIIRGGYWFISHRGEPG